MWNDVGNMCADESPFTGDRETEQRERGAINERINGSKLKEWV